MDVHCTTCAEPWHTYHLWHEIIHETGLSDDDIETWRKLPPAGKLSPRYRERFKALGWEFGRSVINVIRCPCCPKDAKPDAERLKTKAALDRCWATTRTDWQPPSRTTSYEREVATERLQPNP